MTTSSMGFLISSSNLGYLVAGLLLKDLASFPEYLLNWSHVAHIILGLVIGSRMAPVVLSTVLLTYMGLFSCIIPQHANLVLGYLWMFFRSVSLCAGILGFCRAAGPKLRAACALVLVAMVVQVGRTMLPLFIAEDVLPRLSTERFSVETPEVLAMYCEDPVMRSRLGLICEPLEPLSWEEAEKRAAATLATMSSAERHSLMQGIGWTALPKWMPSPLPAFPRRGYYMGNTPPIPRLGIPALKLHDAGNGFRNMPYPLGKVGTTIMWPCSLAFGATWDDTLIGQVAAAIGREYRGKGSNLILGPSVQVQRVARNGRNFEYMSGEDPYLGARLAAAYVRGVQSEGVIACLKHFGFNEQETQRMDGNSVVDERTAWELYYPPFESGVAAGAGSVMCSYNKVNGTHACANEELLNRDLKLKMGFRGFVMTDWWALHDRPEAAVVRGLDQEMPGAGAETFFYAAALEALEQAGGGEYTGYLGLPKKRLYVEPAARILAAAFKMHLMERPSCTPGTDCVEAIESDQRSKANNDLARRVATESVILLQNDGVLPLRAGSGLKTVALIGHALAARSWSTAEIGMAGDYYSGGGSGHCYVSNEQLATPLDRIQQRAARLNWKILTSLSHNVTEALAVARQADVSIILAATTAEEGKDRESLNLDDNANELIAAVAKDGKPTVVLAQVPGAVLMPWREDVSAIALMFLGGEHTGSAWASVLFGDVSPSGKLPVVIPISDEATIQPGLQGDVPYSEGLFTSYRAEDAAAKSAFPFGHGLSYTTFTYDQPKQLTEGECQAFVCVTATVSNSGRSGASGSEVAQAYVEFPPSAEEPKLVLRGFHKTAVLAPGAEEVAMFNFTRRDLSIYRGGGWQLQHDIKLHIGSSSAPLYWLSMSIS